MYFHLLVFRSVRRIRQVDSMSSDEEIVGNEEPLTGPESDNLYEMPTSNPTEIGQY